MRASIDRSLPASSESISSQFQMKFLLLSLLIGLSLTLPNCALQNQKSDEERAFLHMKIGNKYLVAGQHPAALKEFLIAEKLDPKNARLQNNLGLAYYVRKKYQKAEAHIRRAIALNPKFTEARNNLGRTLTKLGLFVEAINELKIATDDLTFKQPEASWSNLGTAYLAKGDFKKANAALRRSLEIRPNHCRTFTTYGRTFFELKKYNKAGLAFDQAIKICKNNSVEAKYFGALSYYRIDKKQQAISRLQEILSNSPNGVYGERADKLLKMMK
ncbi:tetratricopeptide repeat protein [Bdellovibrionales bacterium]|nr:tetratricopeptide repeat protein [Bdellovibrionales bacterium]